MVNSPYCNKTAKTTMYMHVYLNTDEILTSWYIIGSSSRDSLSLSTLRFPGESDPCDPVGLWLVAPVGAACCWEPLGWEPAPVPCLLDVSVRNVLVGGTFWDTGEFPAGKRAWPPLGFTDMASIHGFNIWPSGLRKNKITACLPVHVWVKQDRRVWTVP